MAGVLTHACRCGQTELKITVPAPSAGTRVKCYCADCQTAAHLNGKADDMLSSGGGTDIWQTTPDLMDVVRGQDQLKVLRLSPKGLMRWRAGCCDTPMLNTLPSLKLPFVGVVLRQSHLPEAEVLLGRVTCHAFVASAKPGGDAPRKDVGFKRAGVGVLRRMLLSVMSGRAKQNPLRAADGAPVALVTVVPLDERRAASPNHLK